jgi:toxin ParE1/3/4
LRYVGRIRESCKRIGDAPWAGKPRDDLWPGLRTSSFERRATIAYVIEQDRVRIARTFWGGRDVEGYYRRLLSE